MVMQTRTNFTAQLEEIKGQVVRLKDKCVSDILAAGAVVNGKTDGRDDLVMGRKEEDRLRTSIENDCLDAMLLQQPLFGDDLRFITGSFRIVSDLSHIDSMTRDLVLLVDEIPDKAASKVAGEAAELSRLCAEMVDGAVDAFMKSDVELAQRTIESDQKVNSIYWEVHDKLVKLIRDGKSSAQYLPELIMVVKYFERIGDLAKRVASWAIFRVTGEHIVSAKPSQVNGAEQ